MARVGRAEEHGAGHDLEVGELDNDSLVVVVRGLDLQGLAEAVARAEVRVADAGSSAASLTASGRVFDLVIADPPYDDLAVRRSILRALGATPSALAAQGLANAINADPVLASAGITAAQCRIGVITASLRL